MKLFKPRTTAFKTYFNTVFQKSELLTSLSLVRVQQTGIHLWSPRISGRDRRLDDHSQTYYCLETQPETPRRTQNIHIHMLLAENSQLPSTCIAMQACETMFYSRRSSQQNGSITMRKFRTTAFNTHFNVDFRHNDLLTSFVAVQHQREIARSSSYVSGHTRQLN